MNTPSSLNTPSLTLDLDSVEEKYNTLLQAFEGFAEIFFALKANNHPSIIRKLRGLGSGFDVASEGEIELLRIHGVPGHRIYFSNPVKSPHAMRAAVKAGVTRFAIDCRDEIVKLAAIAPGAQVYVRLKVPNLGSGYPLTKRFGTSNAEDAVNLMLFAQESGLEPIGLTFHVGSQCTNLDNWRHALRICDETWQLAVKSGIETLCLLDMGGGFPIRYHAQEDAPEPHDVARAVQEELEGKFPGLTTLVLEPGRYLVAECGVLRTTVIATKNDDGENIAFLDCGLFNGLMESRDWGIANPGQFWFPIELVTADDDPRQDQVVSLLGPSCDSVDVIIRDLPFKELRMGDVLMFRLSGAYTNSYESYNGLKYPVVTQAGAVSPALKLVRTAGA